MARTDTNVSNLKINRGTKAAIDANLDSIGENEIIFLTDKSVPIPADKVGAADSVDKGKVVSVNASGNYELTTPASPGMTNPMTTQGDIIYGDASGAPTRLAKGTAGQVLKMNSGGTAPEWGADTAGMTNPMTTAGDIIIGGVSGSPIRRGLGSQGTVLTSTGTTAIWQEFILEVMSAADVNNLFIEGDDEGMKIVLWNTNGTGLSSTLTDALGCDLSKATENAHHYEKVLPNVLSKLHVHLTYNGVEYYGISTSIANLESDDYGTPIPDLSDAGSWSAAGATVLAGASTGDPTLAIMGVSADGTDYIYGRAPVMRGGVYNNNVSFGTLRF